VIHDGKNQGFTMLSLKSDGQKNTDAYDRILPDLTYMADYLDMSPYLPDSSASCMASSEYLTVSRKKRYKRLRYN
jgi:hypothetical protein